MLPIDHPRFFPAMKLIDEGQFAEAARQLSELAAGLSGESRAGALYWKSICLGRLGQREDAIASIDDAMTEAEPDSAVGICLQLQKAYYPETDEVPGANIAAVRSVLSRYAKQFSTPDFFWQYMDAKAAIGKGLLRVGEYSEGIAELEESLSSESRAAARYSKHLWLQDAYYKTGRLEEAKEHLQNALKDAESAPQTQLPADHPALIRYELALVAYKQHRLDDAQRELTLASAVAQNPKTLRCISKLWKLLHEPKPVDPPSKS
ncbi:MAG TPA: tetratricopeptide repeat protein [Terriglobales bacterium]|nr:tetratricopeptide repeat protein [Terriglobales bacterium]